MTRAAAPVSGIPDPVLRRVIAGRIPADFAPGADLVPGPWVLSGQEADWPGWEEHGFRLPLTTADEIADADRETARIAVALTAMFASRLAARHGSDRSAEFWYLLLIRWVLETVQAAWLRYREAEALIADADGARLSIEAPAADTAWRFRDIADMYARGICDRGYNAWLLAKALRALRPDRIDWTTVPAASDSEPADAGSRPKSLLSRAYAALKTGRCDIGNMGSEYDLRTKLASAAAHLTLNLWLALVPAKREIGSCRAAADPALRDRIGVALHDYLVDVLEASLPEPFGDRFAEHDRRARAVRTRRGRLSIKTISYQMSADRLFEAAHRIDRGEGLVHLQHGCNYGICKAYSLGAIIEYNQHAFLSWGWTHHGDYEGRFVPLPAPQLAPWIGNHRTENDRIVLVSSAAPFLPNRLISNGEIHCHGRRADRVAFVTALPGALREKLLYRPYRQLPYTAEDAGYFARRFPSLRQIASQPEFFREARRCRLMVIDHPGLTLYQALAAGTPFMGFWTDLQWPVDDAVKPMFDALRRVGILFDSGAAAADAIAAQWDDIEGRWNRDEVRDAVDRLRRYNAGTRRGWLLSWMKAIRTL